MELLHTRSILSTPPAAASTESLTERSSQLRQLRNTPAQSFFNASSGGDWWQLLHNDSDSVNSNGDWHAVERLREGDSRKLDSAEPIATKAVPKSLQAKSVLRGPSTFSRLRL
eukprot:GHVR01059763.1.p2 GENE.GHVR01059763.1~~GHVR01059763.1.p2  ORF type:complete len:113 (+),score=19.36 GHVR01059763.1:850-1188(+)